MTRGGCVGEHLSEAPLSFEAVGNNRGCAVLLYSNALDLVLISSLNKKELEQTQILNFQF